MRQLSILDPRTQDTHLGGMIAQEILPDPLIQPCLGVLELLSPGERDLVRLVVEVINELRDPQGSEEDGEMVQASPSPSDT